MTTSAELGSYERYEQPLTLLADDGILRSAIAAAGANRGWWRPAAHWLRRYGRFWPDQPRFANFVFETAEHPQELCHIEVFKPGAEMRSQRSAWVTDVPAGVLAITRFPHDEALPQLRDFIARPGFSRVVRYRPGRRCTLRFDPSENSRAGYAKVFADASGAAVHHAGKVLWSAASAGNLGFAVAEPFHWDERTRSLWQGVVPGTPVKQRLFSAAGGDLAFRMGCALGTLPSSGLRCDLIFSADVQLQRTYRYAQELIRRVPQAEGTIKNIVNHLEVGHAQLCQRQLVPIHGAPHMHQWLVEGDCLGLVDFDRFSLGDPELDVATFTGEIDFEDPVTVPIAAINHGFIAGYESIAGPLDQKRLVLYRAHKKFAMACHAAQAVRPDGAHRAMKRTRRVLDGILAQSPC